MIVYDLKYQACFLLRIVPLPEANVFAKINFQSKNWLKLLMAADILFFCI